MVIKITDTNSLSFKLGLWWKRLWCRHYRWVSTQKWDDLPQDDGTTRFGLVDVYYECDNCRARKRGISGEVYYP